MPNYETPDELADKLADLLDIYEDPRCCEPAADWTCCDEACLSPDEFAPHCDLADAPSDGWEVLHVDGCMCRVWWVPVMAYRIRRAVANEAFLYPMSVTVTPARMPASAYVGGGGAENNRGEHAGS